MCGVFKGEESTTVFHIGMRGPREGDNHTNTMDPNATELVCVRLENGVRMPTLAYSVSSSVSNSIHYI